MGTRPARHAGNSCSIPAAHLAWPGSRAAGRPWSPAAQHGHAMAAADATDRTRLPALVWPPRHATSKPSPHRSSRAAPCRVLARPGSSTSSTVSRRPLERRAPEQVDGIDDCQRRCAKHHPGAAQFADLRAEQQTATCGMSIHAVLRRPPLHDARGPARTADYGGNRDRLGWKLIGLDDQHALAATVRPDDAGYTGFVPYPGTPLAEES